VRPQRGPLGAAARRVRLDEALPRFDFRERHATRARAQAADVMRGLQAVRPDEVRMLRELMWLRSLPARLAGRRVLAPAGGAPLLAVAQCNGFLRLFEEERELVPLPEPDQAPAPRAPREDAPLKRAIEVLSQQQAQPQAA